MIGDTIDCPPFIPNGERVFKFYGRLNSNIFSLSLEILNGLETKSILVSLRLFGKTLSLGEIPNESLDLGFLIS